MFNDIFQQDNEKVKQSPEDLQASVPVGGVWKRPDFIQDLQHRVIWIDAWHDSLWWFPKEQVCQSARAPKLLCKPDFLQEHLSSTDTSLAQVPIRRARSFPSSFCFCLPFQLETVAATGGGLLSPRMSFFLFPFQNTNQPRGSTVTNTKKRSQPKAQR